MRSNALSRVVCAALLVCAGPLAFYLAHAQAVVRLQPANRAPGSPAGPERPADAVPEVEPSPEEHARIAELIEQLGAPHMAQRDRAMGELAQYEGKALGQVRAALKHDDDEIAWRCALLEEVIQSRQGELFLAARALQMSIAELNGHLAANDITPLLSILKARGQPGMATVWAQALGRVAAENRLFIVAELCREVEGPAGYGIALARCALLHGNARSYRNLLLATMLLPPDHPADALETLVRIRFSDPGAAALESVLSAGEDFRDLYAPRDMLAARQGRLLPGAPEPEGAPELRLALALEMTSRIEAADLAAAGVPPAEQMSPLVLSCWLRLLARSGLHDRLEGTLLSLLANDGAARLAAAALASAAPVPAVIAIFDTLPLPAQLAVLDTWWVYPRDPETLHPFYLKLADSDVSALAVEATVALGQYRSPATVRKLVQLLPKHPAVALDALTPMADLLPSADPQGLEALIAGYPTRPVPARPAHARLLAATGDSRATEVLLAHWRKELTMVELPTAMELLASQAATPAGAWCAAVAGDQTRGDAAAWMRRAANPTQLAILKNLLLLPPDDGFALLQEIAGDAADHLRSTAATALALAGKDGQLIDEWLRRLGGEAPDPRPHEFGRAVAASATPTAQRYRRDALQQGLRAPGFQWVLQSFHMGRCPELDVADLYAVIAETPESSRQYINAWRWSHLPPPAGAARNLVTAQLMASPGGIQDPVQAIWIARSGVDVLELLYGQNENPVPTDAGQSLITAMFADPARAQPILARAQNRDDGANWASLRLARAWAGMLDERENKRLSTAISADPARSWGALRFTGRADSCDVQALRALLDRLGPQPHLFSPTGTASITVMERRWGTGSVQAEGAAEALTATGAEPTLPHTLLKHWLPGAPADWGSWWKCRRALLEVRDGRFTFKELP